MPARRPSPEQNIIAATKHLGMTLAEMRETMDRNSGELRQAKLTVPRIRGQLRLNIGCRQPQRESWRMSVVLYSPRFDGRIQCIDWEGWFVDIDGLRQVGFHEHLWDEAARSCDHQKRPLVGFDPATVLEFIEAGFAIMKVIPREEEANV
jgi:hypothetical protein